MRQEITETIALPEGIACTIANRALTCTKDSVSLVRVIDSADLEVAVNDKTITIHCLKGNKKHLNLIRSLAAHIRNMFEGLQNKFVYTLEACNVHFPMTLKIDGNKLIINNFLGEKTPRFALIPAGAQVDIKGLKITVSAHDREVAGQAFANIEKATKVRNRDRRVFQDGIYLVHRPGRRA